jgi:hypothetical protein
MARSSKQLSVVQRIQDIIIELGVSFCYILCIIVGGISSCMSLTVYVGVRQSLLPPSARYSVAEFMVTRALAALVLFSFAFGTSGFQTLFSCPVNIVVLEMTGELLLILLCSGSKSSCESNPERYLLAAVVPACTWFSSAAYLLDWGHPLQQYPYPQVVGCVAGLLIASAWRLGVLGTNLACPIQ